MTRRSRSAGRLGVLASFAVFVLGCGGESDWATVSGLVTLNDEPVENARVEFQHEQGSASFGTTTAWGEYELMYSRNKEGAEPGKHRVQIWIPALEVDEEGKPIDPPDGIPRYYRWPERKEVVEPGYNEKNFKLTKPTPRKR
ncbi:MAG: carboxypeptidase-like regulatory domain-containing protein [Planctomycetota bacterium]|jgi:hypothetical protein